MSVLEKVLQWSGSRPTWQRDALRRLVQQDQLSETDIGELTQICLSAYGATNPDNAAPTAIPLANEHIATLAAIGNRSRLSAIRDVQNVNALAAGRELKFAPAGLTVIYGDNGSGKSGYTRILKAICRARGGTPKIFPNIFEDAVGVPTAHIDYYIDDSPLTHVWIDGEAGPDALGAVSVFDTSCASVYVEGKTDVAFRPFGLDLFPRLVNACERVKASINASIAAQGSARSFPELSGETKVANLIRSLGAKGAKASLEALSGLSDAEAVRLAELKQLVAQLHAQDPKRRAHELRLRAARFRSLLQHAETAEKALAEEVAKKLRDSQRTTVSTAEAAQLASGAAFDSEPLPGVGSAAWQALWTAAKKYSETEAYSGLTFPVIDAASCVLCQQPIEPPAAERLARFKVFVEQEARTAHERAVRLLEELLKPLQEMVVLRSSDENVLAEILTEDEDLGLELKAYLTHLQDRLGHLITACLSGQWEELSPMHSSPCAKLLPLITTLEKTALELEQAGEPTSAATLFREHAELLDREKLSKLRTEVEKEIARQQKISTLKAALRDTDTTGITTKNTELTKSAVTEELRMRFAQELQDLNLRHLTVSVGAQHGAKGVMYHKIAFDDAKANGWGVQDVLSEGEHRCIALAAFLAELSMQSVGSTIILDDPVSSLDHSRREFVARRLAQEAKKRPVVVLTHDIVFLLLLQEQAESNQAEFAGRFLDREKGALGVPVDGLPWYGMPLRKRIGWLRQEVVKLRKTYKDECQEAYDREAAFLWGRLREAWECGVEEVLLNGAVKRFSRKVSTQPLKVVHDITADDITAVDAGMTACSTWLPGHDHAPALNTAMPGPEEIHKAVEALESWRESIAHRRDKKKAS